MEKVKKKYIVNASLDSLVECYCPQKASRRMSNSEKNPGRSFYVCRNSPNGCNFWQWADQIQLRLESFGVINGNNNIPSMHFPSSSLSQPPPTSFNNSIENKRRSGSETARKYTYALGDYRNNYSHEIDDKNDHDCNYNYNYNKTRTSSRKPISENPNHYTSFSTSPLMDDIEFWTAPPSSSLSSHQFFNNHNNSNNGDDDNIDNFNDININNNGNKTANVNTNTKNMLGKGSSRLIKILETHLNKQDKRLRVYKRSVESLRSLLKTNGNDNDDEFGSLKNKMLTLEKRNRELEEKNEELEEKNEELEEKSEELEESIEEIREREKEVEGKNKYLEEKIKEIEGKNEKLEENKKEVEEENEKLQEKNKNLELETEVLKEDVRRLEEKIEDESELDLLRNEVNSLITVNEDIEAELEHLRFQYDSLVIGKDEDKLTEENIII